MHESSIRRQACATVATIARLDANTNEAVVSDLGRRSRQHVRRTGKNSIALWLVQLERYATGLLFLNLTHLRHSKWCYLEAQESILLSAKLARRCGTVHAPWSGKTVHI